MIKMKDYGLKFYLLLLFSSIILFSCDDDNDDDPKPSPTPTPSKTELTKTQKVNNFIKTAMEDVYLWSEELPKIDPLKESNSFDYFKKLTYKDDRWSWVTDDVKALEASFQGTETTFGYSLSFVRFSNSDNVFAQVQFVYPNSPASEANLKRGDIILKYDGKQLDINNYRKLIQADKLTVSLAKLQGNTIVLTGVTKTMTAREMSLDPAKVIESKIITKGNRKIAYLFYAQYIGNFNSSLDEKFADFISKGATDLVLDLRYNPGGGVDAAQHLCSMIAPLDAVDNEKVLVSYKWNKKYQDLWTKEGQKSQLGINFDKTVASKMNLNKVYILTGRGSASASELTITGLRAYMNVTTIGATTHGKYTASRTIKPKHIYKNQSDITPIENWAIQPIILKYANAEGVSDFKDGFMPDHSVKDDIFSKIPLGDENEPLFAKAISLITGTPTAIARTKTSDNFTVFDRGFSRFDEQKNVLNIDIEKK